MVRYRRRGQGPGDAKILLRLVTAVTQHLTTLPVGLATVMSAPFGGPNHVAVCFLYHAYFVARVFALRCAGPPEPRRPRGEGGAEEHQQGARECRVPQHFLRSEQPVYNQEAQQEAKVSNRARPSLRPALTGGAFLWVLAARHARQGLFFRARELCISGRVALLSAGTMCP